MPGTENTIRSSPLLSAWTAGTKVAMALKDRCQLGDDVWTLQPQIGRFLQVGAHLIELAP